MIEPGVALSTAIYGGTAGVGLGLALAFVKWAAHFIAGRLDVKEARLDANMEQILSRLNEEVERLGGECTELRAECARLRKAVHKCEERHRDSEARVKQLEAMFQGYGDARQVAQMQAAADHAKDKADKKAEE